MSPWLIAAVLRPFGSLVLFGLAAFVAHKLISPLFPDGPLKRLLYNRSIRKNHPWKFALGGLAVIYGTVLVIGLIVRH